MPSCPCPSRHRRRDLLLAFAGLAIGSARASTVAIQIGVTVRARTQVRLEGVGAFQVTPADVDRGWVDLTSPIALRVQSNVQGAVTLEILATVPQVRGVRLQGLNGLTEIGHGGGLVSLAVTAREMQIPLTARFFLAADAAPGRYPWPLQVAAVA